MPGYNCMRMAEDRAGGVQLERSMYISGLRQVDDDDYVKRNTNSCFAVYPSVIEPYRENCNRTRY